MNKWKISFLLIIVINLVIILSISAFILIPSNQNEVKEETGKMRDDQTVSFLVQSQKKTLTKLINHYLEKETKQKNLQYKVDLKESVHVYGEIEAFNKEINMTLILEPIVKSDGNLQLLVKELTIGRLKLPVSYVLKYMNTNYHLPSYVKIDSGKKMIDIHLNELTFKNGLSARVESFNLKNDDITFRLYVPLP